MNGKLVPWDDARIHVCSHVVHYGSSVFEGVRCYKTPKGSAVFRLDAHTERLFNSAKIYWMEIPLTRRAGQRRRARDDPREQARGLLHPADRRTAATGQLGVNPLGSPVDVAIMVWDWGKYLGKEAIEQGVDVCVSSWTRMAPNTLPGDGQGRRPTT